MTQRRVGRPLYALAAHHAEWCALTLGRRQVRKVVMRTYPVNELLGRNLHVLLRASIDLADVNHPLHTLYQDDPLPTPTTTIARAVGCTRAAVSAALVRAGLMQRKLKERKTS